MSDADLFQKGTPVVLSELGKQQRVARVGGKGIVTSPYPIKQCVTVKWNYKRSRDRVHVDFLTVTAGEGT